MQIATADTINKWSKEALFASTRLVQIATLSCTSWGGKAIFASTRPVQIATSFRTFSSPTDSLCLHTLRADCNCACFSRLILFSRFASTRSVQIATGGRPRKKRSTPPLPPHTPCRLQRWKCRADAAVPALPPHAPCRLQRISTWECWTFCSFASTRSVQIATPLLESLIIDNPLCLHTLRADCNGRNVQNCNMHFSERVLSW